MNEEYWKHYDENSFSSKLNKVGKKLGSYVLEKVVLLYFVLKDSDTPAKSKVFIMSALGYFILPVDLIPDIIPILGYGDDLALLIKVIHSVSKNIKEEHRIEAKKKVEDLLK